MCVCLCVLSNLNNVYSLDETVWLECGSCSRNNVANTLESDAILMSICPSRLHRTVANLCDGLLKGPVC